MTTPTKTAQKPKLPDKLRMVPPGRPPKGYRWCKRGERITSVDACVYPDGAIKPIGPYTGCYSVGEFESDLGDNGKPIHGAWIRPMPQPKRAEKAKQSVSELADAYAQKTYKAILDQGIAALAFEVGYRAANRRAK